MRIGVDYYPEHWDESLWEEDINRMAECGVKVVRLAEFAWSVLEPKQDVFDFDWLDRAVSMLAERGMQIVLCTPTNCPPLWLYRAYPEAIQMDASGNRLALGIRGHRCYRSPKLRERAEIILDKMLSRYGSHPAVIAWQIDNELEANFCRCNYCSGAFRSWLQKKYGTLEKLNKTYGNTVWSGSYSDWAEVMPPMGSYQEGWYNPSLMLDYHRFAMEDTVDFVRFQQNIIRRYAPAVPITTNTWFCEKPVHFHKLFADLDFVSYDNYPPIRIPDDPGALYSHAFHLDFMRGIRQQNFWIMEQLSGGMGSWAPMSPTPLPGMIAGYALQAFAHGADTVVHFRWRTAVIGAEMFWHGILDHSNRPGRRFKEFQSLCKTAAALEDAAGSHFLAQAAILYDEDCDAALRIQPQAHGFHYYHQLKLWHDACTHLGLGVDLLPTDADLSGYPLVIVPAMFVMHPETAEKLHAYVHGGGTLLLTCRSGVKNFDNQCLMDDLPGLLHDLAGVRAAEYNPLGYGTGGLEMDGTSYEITQWCDILELIGAEPAAFYSSDFYAGTPAATVNRSGNGTVWYCGTVGKRAFTHALLEKIVIDAGIPFVAGLPDGVELTQRQKDNTIFRFLFNNSEQEQQVSLGSSTHTLQPFEMHVDRLTEGADHCNVIRTEC